MSTRSNIAIKLREEDCKNGVQRFGEEFHGPYLQVYCHFDGYPNGVGRDLIEKKLTYDEALEFILKGDRSSTDDGTSYYEWRDEAYENVKPKVMTVPNQEQEYLYLLEENEETGMMDVYQFIGVAVPKLMFKRIYLNKDNEIEYDDKNPLYIYNTNGIF